MADMRLSTFGCRDPMVISPRRIVPDVPPMLAFKFSNPIQIFIQVKCNDFSRLTLRCSLRFHGAPSEGRMGGVCDARSDSRGV